ncbi:MAG TPA: TadE/TadG family type IV pilus assembly protein, partial [Anaerolineales bacterium]|nr:TadE/TadG family type IV pilus assembly protein [Anaerolineales bacterium]
MRRFTQGLRNWFHQRSHPIGRGPRRGQSLVEMALVLPLLLILLSSLAEFGFAFNRFINVVEAVREGARFGVDQQPNPDKGGRELVPNPAVTGELMSNMDCNNTQDFYAKISCRIAFSMQSVAIRPTEHLTNTAVPNDHYLPADQILITVARVYRDVLCNDDVPPATRIPNSDPRCKPTIMEGPDDNPDVDPKVAGIWPWPSYDPAPREAGTNPASLFPGTIGHDGSRAGQWRLTDQAWDLRNGRLLETQFDRAKLQQHLDNTWDPSGDRAAPSQGILL